MSEAAANPAPRTQIDGLSFAMILLDPEFAIAELNPAAEDLLGQSAKRVLGRPLFAVVEFGDGRVAALAVEDDGPVVARGVAIQVGGRSLPVDLTISPLASYPGWRVVTLSEAKPDAMAQDEEPHGALRARNQEPAGGDPRGRAVARSPARGQGRRACSVDRRRGRSDRRAGRSDAAA